MHGRRAGRRASRRGRCRTRSSSSTSPIRSRISAASTASCSPAASANTSTAARSATSATWAAASAGRFAQRLDAGALPWPLLPAGECIRATALGASEYSVQLSGNTSYISNPGALLPRRNLQVLQPPYVCDETIDPDEARRGDPRATSPPSISSRARREVALALALAGRAVLRAHRRVRARASRAACADTIARKEAALHHARRRRRADARRDPARGAAASRARSW